MAKLTIFVGVNNNQTVSKFKARRYGNIEFHNDGGDTLVVTIDGASGTDSPICEAGNPVATFEILAGDPARKFTVCGDKTKWTEFKYTATIGTNGSEDPIVIIEKSKAFEHPAALVSAGVLIGAVIAVAIMKMMAGKTRPAT
ncbi:MAG: hypothetical protein ACRES3_04285 [Steroidobacteraceae bacterium]